MKSIALHDFIGKNRDELIRRCRVKVAKRSSPQPTEAEIDHGVPLFLEQLSQELRQTRASKAEEKGARMPALMTVPLMVFILPTLITVLIAPAILQVLSLT